MIVNIHCQCPILEQLINRLYTKLFIFESLCTHDGFKLMTTFTNMTAFTNKSAFANYLLTFSTCVRRPIVTAFRTVSL